ncbi:hypothetical protein N599_35865 [Saccharopolyspora erythraea D]|nr:hypothetical protein N599_35865 [Saccharopolyspora erythraea D]
MVAVGVWPVAEPCDSAARFVMSCRRSLAVTDARCSSDERDFAVE